MKRIGISVIVALLSVALMMPLGAASADKLPFVDVAETAWYYSDVKNAYKLGLIKGRTTELFVPEGELMYSEAVKLAACMYQVSVGDPIIPSDGNPWYRPYADYCLEKGIITEEYDWNALISRGAYIDIFSRALPEDKLAAINLIEVDAIPDVDAEHPYAEGIYRLYRAGVVQGVNGDHECRPDSVVTRSEVAAVLTRMMDTSERLEFSLTAKNEEKVITVGEYVLMKTPVGSILMDVDSRDRFRVSENQTESLYTAAVFGNVDGLEKKLFTLSVGRSGDGHLIGSVSGADIRVKIEELSFDEAWSADTRNFIRILQDEVNTVIMQIQKFKGFTEPQGNKQPGISKPVEYGSYVFLRTPIGDITMSERWIDNLTAEQYSTEGFTAKVYGKAASGEKLLYKIYIGTGSTAGFLLGYVDGCPVRIEVSELSFSARWTDGDISLIEELQDEVNTVIAQIQQIDGFTNEKPGGDIPSGTQPGGDSTLMEGHIIIKTPVGDFAVSEAFRDNITASEERNESGYFASVYGNTDSGKQTKLFTLCVGTESAEGYLVGYVDGIPVSVIVEELSLGGEWSHEDAELMYILQDEVNHIIMQINALEGFSKELIMDDEQIDTEGDYTLAKTPVGDILFAKKWRSTVRVSTTAVQKGQIFTVIGKTGSGEIELFAFAFGCGEGEGVLLGVVGGYDVRVDIDELSFGRTWSEADKSLMQTVQNEVNSIIMQFYEMDGFVPAA